MHNKSKIAVAAGFVACTLGLAISCSQNVEPGPGPGPTPEETWDVSFVSTTLELELPVTKIAKSKDLTLRLQLNDPTGNDYRLPYANEADDCFIVYTGETQLKAVDGEFDYTLNDGGLTATLSVTHDKYAGNITINGMAALNTVSVTIAENDSLFDNHYFELITNPEEADPEDVSTWDIVTEVQTGQDLDAYLFVTPIGYDFYDFERLPSLGGIEIGGNPLRPNQYYYNHATGEIFIEGRYISGDIIISAVPNYVPVHMGAFGYSFFADSEEEEVYDPLDLNPEVIYYGQTEHYNDDYEYMNDGLATFHHFGDGVATFDVDGSVTTENALDIDLIQGNHYYDYSVVESDKDLDMTVSIKSNHYYSYDLPMPKDPFSTEYRWQQYFDVIIGQWKVDEEGYDYYDYKLLPTNAYEYIVSPDCKSAHFHLNYNYFKDADCIYLGVEPIKVAREIHYTPYYYDALGIRHTIDSSDVFRYGDVTWYGGFYHYCGLGDNSHWNELEWEWETDSLLIYAELNPDYNLAFPLDDNLYNDDTVNIEIGDYDTYYDSDFTNLISYARGDEYGASVFESTIIIDTETALTLFHPEVYQDLANLEDGDPAILEYGYAIHTDDWYAGDSLIETPYNNYEFVNPFADIEIEVEVKPVVDVVATDKHITVDPTKVVADEDVSIELSITDTGTIPVAYDYEGTFDMPDEAPEADYVYLYYGDDPISGDPILESIDYADCTYTKDDDDTATLTIDGDEISICEELVIDLQAVRTAYKVEVRNETTPYAISSYIEADYIDTPIAGDPVADINVINSYAATYKLTEKSVSKVAIRTPDGDTSVDYTATVTPSTNKQEMTVEFDGLPEDESEDVMVEIYASPRTWQHNITVTDGVDHQGNHYELDVTSYIEPEDELVITISLKEAYQDWDLPSLLNPDMSTILEDEETIVDPGYLGADVTYGLGGNKTIIITITSMDYLVGDINIDLYSPIQPQL